MQPSSESSRSDDDIQLRRGPWTEEEDGVLIHCISHHGEGRWNLLARSSGLRRTGKSCRLRWLNYLKPDVKRGNLTPHEQLLILELHLKWGNRWSKIAKHLPGRTDNEIKNYWRTRVQKQARHLKVDSNSAAFQQLIRNFWVPRLLQKIHGSSIQPQNPQFLSRTSQAPSPISVYEPQYSSRHQALTNCSLENNTGSSSNSTESTYISPLPPLAECPSNPFHGIGDSGFDNSPSGYGIEAFSPPLCTGSGDFKNFIDYDQFGEGNSSMNEFSVDSLWSMDELWLSGQG